MRSLLLPCLSRRKHLCLAVKLKFVTCLILCFLAVSFFGQSSPTVNGPIAIALPALNAPHTSVQRDAAALAMLAAYFSAVGDDTWNSYSGTGVISYNRQQGTVSGTATITLVGEYQFRFDTSSQGHSESMRSSMTNAGLLRDGASAPISESQSEGGLFAFAHLRKSLLEDQTTSLIDGGVVQTSAGPLHRITIERLRRSARNRSIKREQSVLVMDLYFDPTTNLLTQSSFSNSSSSRPSTRASIMTYSDYQTVGTSTMPYSYSLAAGGHILWTLQLNSLQLSTPVDASMFEMPEGGF